MGAGAITLRIQVSTLWLIASLLSAVLVSFGVLFDLRAFMAIGGFLFGWCLCAFVFTPLSQKEE